MSKIQELKEQLSASDVNSYYKVADSLDSTIARLKKLPKSDSTKAEATRKELEDTLAKGALLFTQLLKEADAGYVK